MTTSYVITDQEYKLLDFVAYGEVAGSSATQYNLVNGNGVQPLTEMSIREVIERFGAKNAARGRYQFIGQTLIEQVDKSGIDRNLRFSEEVQDYLGLRLVHQAKLEAWKQGRCTDTGGDHTPKASTNHEAFLMNLARIWAAKPIPIAINDRVVNGNSYPRPRNSTYYAGPNNRSKGTASAHLSDLESIYDGGAGNSYTINFGETSRPYPSQGRSISEQAEVSAGGGQNYGTQGRPHANSIAGSLRDLRSRGVGFTSPLQPGVVNTGRQSPAAGMLPQVSDPYRYKRIDPLDNRYDFRTGEKVIDLLINGTNPASTYPINEDMRRYGDPNTPATQIDLNGELEQIDYEGIQLPDGDTSPPTGKTGDPYAPSEFDPGEFVVNAIMPNSRPDGPGPTAVIRTTGRNRAGEFVVGEEIYRARTGSPDDVQVITVTAIDPAARTVTLSDGTVIQAAGPYGQGSGKINEKIDQVAPPNETLSGDYKTIRGSIQNDLKTLNSKVREISPFVTVVPVDLGDNFVHYISADYYRDSSNQYPAAAYSPSPARVAGVVYATDIAKQLGGELPSKDLISKIDGKADKTLTPPSISPTDPKYPAEVNKIVKQAGIIQGEVVAGIKVAIDSSNSGAGSTKPNNADYSKGVRVSWGKISKASGVRSGPITTLRS